MSGPEEMSRDELIVVVRRQAGQIIAMAAQLSELMESNEALSGKLARLEHLLSRNSGNSSSPPSKDDDPGKPAPPEKNTRDKGGPQRARGKQPGAPGTHLAWIEYPDDRLDRFPQGRCDCSDDLVGARDLGIVDRYQQHTIALSRLRWDPKPKIVAAAPVRDIAANVVYLATKPSRCGSTADGSCPSRHRALPDRARDSNPNQGVERWNGAGHCRRGGTLKRGRPPENGAPDNAARTVLPRLRTARAAPTDAAAQLRWTSRVGQPPCCCTYLMHCPWFVKPKFWNLPPWQSLIDAGVSGVVLDCDETNDSSKNPPGRPGAGGALLT